MAFYSVSACRDQKPARIGSIGKVVGRSSIVVSGIQAPGTSTYIQVVTQRGEIIPTFW